MLNARATHALCWVLATFLLVPGAAFAQDAAESGTTLTVIEGTPARTVADRGATVAEITALSTVATLALGGSATFFLVARNTADQRDAIVGQSLYDQGQRYTLEQQQRSEQILGFTLLSVGILAASGLTYVLWDSRSARGVDQSLTIAPAFERGGAGVLFDATF